MAKLKLTKPIPKHIPKPTGRRKQFFFLGGKTSMTPAQLSKEISKAGRGTSSASARRMLEEVLRKKAEAERKKRLAEEKRKAEEAKALKARAEKIRRDNLIKERLIKKIRAERRNLTKASADLLRQIRTEASRRNINISTAGGQSRFIIQLNKESRAFKRGQAKATGREAISEKALIDLQKRADKGDLKAVELLGKVSKGKIFGYEELKDSLVEDKGSRVSKFLVPGVPVGFGLAPPGTHIFIGKGRRIKFREQTGAIFRKLEERGFSKERIAKIAGLSETQIDRMKISKEDKKTFKKLSKISQNVTLGILKEIEEDPEKIIATALLSRVTPSVLQKLGATPTAIKIVKKIPKPIREKGGAVVGKALTGAYLASAGIRVAGQPTAELKAEQAGRILAGEIIPFEIGTRLGVRGLLKEELQKELNRALKGMSKQRKVAFREYMKQAEIFGRYEPTAKNIKLNNIETIPSKKAQSVIRKFLKKSDGKLVVGGSVAQTAQVDPGRKLGDMDLYIDGGKISPTGMAKKLASQLKKQGVQRVSSVGKQVTIKGKKAIEFHDISRLNVNIQQVTPSWRNPSAYIIKTPEGIRIQRVGLQAKRKLVASFADPKRLRTGKYRKDLKDFKKISDKIFRNAVRKSKSAFFFKKKRIKRIEKIFKRKIPRARIKKIKKVKITKKLKKPRILKKPVTKAPKKVKVARGRGRGRIKRKKISSKFITIAKKPKVKRVKVRRLKKIRKPKVKRIRRKVKPSQKPIRRIRKRIKLKPSQIPRKRRIKVSQPPRKIKKRKRYPPSQPPRKPPRKPPKIPKPPRDFPSQPPARPPKRFPLPKPIKGGKRIRRSKKKKTVAFVFKRKIKRKKLKKTIPVFNVYGKSKRKFIKLNVKPLTRDDALSRGAFAVDRTTAKTFKIVPAGKLKKAGKLLKSERGYFKRQGFKLREFRIRKGRKFKLKNKYIEKRKYGIDTRSEKRGLTIAKLLKQRRTGRKIKPIKRKVVRRIKRKVTPSQRKVLLQRLKKARRVRLQNLKRRKK